MRALSKQIPLPLLPPPPPPPTPFHVVRLTLVEVCLTTTGFVTHHRMRDEGKGSVRSYLPVVSTRHSFTPLVANVSTITITYAAPRIASIAVETIESGVLALPITAVVSTSSRTEPQLMEVAIRA